MLLAMVTRPSIVWPVSPHKRYPSPSKAPSKNALLPCTNWDAQPHTLCPTSWSFMAHSHYLTLTKRDHSIHPHWKSPPTPTTLSSGIPKGQLFNCRDEHTTYPCTIFKSEPSVNVL